MSRMTEVSPLCNLQVIHSSAEETLPGTILTTKHLIPILLEELAKLPVSLGHG